MRHRIPRISALALVLLMTSTACAAPGPEPTPSTDASTCVTAAEPERGLCVADDAQSRELADLIHTAFEEGRMGALVVGVWRDGQPLVTGGLGESMTGVPATVDMSHRIGNVSASFLTTLFLQLVDEGELHLDDRLSDWYPDLPGADRVTLGDLSRSTSGYRHHPATDGFLAAFDDDPFRAWDPAQLIAYGTAGGPEFTPGTDWQFSDTNLLLLGEVIRAQTGVSTHELITERILEPLGLDSTTSPSDARLAEPVLHAYTAERGVWEDATFWNPQWVPYGGDMASTQSDLATWLPALAAGELLSADALTEMTAPVTVGLGPNTDSLYYAMGLGMTNGWMFFNPSLQGYSAAVGIHPDEDVMIVMYATRRQDADQDARPEQALFVDVGTRLAPNAAPSPLLAG